MAGRPESRHFPPQDRYGLPQVSYPTPNINDLVIIEDVPIRDQAYAPLLPGTPHPKKATAKLVWQGPVKGNGESKAVRRIYATSREAQDAYNASLSYTSDSKDYPTFVRSYILPRLNYTRATDLQPLKTLTGIRLNSGGSGYSQDTTVVIIGNGTGATAECEVINGVIVAVWLTSGGDGYTTQPTVGFVDGTGTGANATVFFQPQTALLVKEEAVPAEGELSSLFIRVTRIYQTLPGPWLTQWVNDERTGLPFKIERRYIAATSVSEPNNALPVTGSAKRVITEYQPETANVYVEIRSSFPSEDALAAKTQTSWVTDGHSFPNLLESGKFEYIYAISGDGENWAFDIALNLEITAGYSGPCDGFLTEYYTYRPEQKISSLTGWEITKIWPRADTIYAGLWKTSTTSAQARLMTFVVPETLRNETALSSTAPTGTTPMVSASVPASTPTLSEFRDMDYIVKSITVERWRGDIYIVRLLKIKNPHYIGGA